MAVFERNNDAVLNQYYNALIEAYNENFSSIFGELELSTSEHPIVTQRNLNILRNKVKEISKRSISSFDGIHDDNYAEDDIIITQYPYQCSLLADKAIEINEGKGFLILPGKYNSSGQAIYQYDDPEDYWTSNGRSVPENIPPLYEHFVDIKNAMEQIQHVVLELAPNISYSNIKDCNWQLLSWNPDYYDNYTPNTENVSEDFVMLSEAGASVVNPGLIRIHHQQNQYSQTLERDISLLALELETFYQRVNETDIQPPENKVTSKIINNSDSIFHESESLDTVLADGDYYQEQGYYIYHHSFKCKVLQVVNVSINVDMPPYISDDTADNDLMAVGCANITPCTTTHPSPNQGRTIFGSCGNNNSAYLALYVSALKPKDALVFTISKDTCVAGNSSGQITLDNGTIAKYQFTKLIRPSGMPVIMAWRFSNGNPVEAHSTHDLGYVMTSESNGSFVIRFSDGVTHYYRSMTSGGTFNAAEKEVNGEKIRVSFPSGCVSTSLVSTNYANGTAEVNEGFIKFTYAPGGLVSPVEYGQSYLYSAMFYPTEEAADTGTASLQYGRVDVSGGGIEPPTTTSAGSASSSTANSIDNTPIVFTTRRKSSPAANAAMPIISILSTGGGGITDDGYGDMVFSSSQYSDPETGTVYVKTELARSDSNKLTYTALKGDEEALKETLEYQTIDHQQFLTRKVIGLRTNDCVIEYGYWLNDGNSNVSGNAHGKIRYQLNYDESWVYYVYDNLGRLIKTITPFGNTKLDFDSDDNVIEPVESECRIEELSYTPELTGEETYSGDLRVRRRIEKVKGVEVSRRYYVYLPNEYREIVCRTANATINDANNLVTTYTSYTSGNYEGRQHKVIYPDGTISITTYAATSDGETVTTLTGKPNADKSAVVDGTKIVKTMNSAGLTVQKQEIDIASGLIIDSVQTEYYLGKPYRTTYLDGSKEITGYSCCGIQRHIARDGSETVYQYTPDHRLAQTTKNQLVTTNEYNAAGQVKRTTVFPEGVTNASYLLTLREYNDAGELVKEKVAINPVSGSDPTDDASYAVTTYSQSKVGDYWRRTRTNPDGSVIYEDYNCDGTLAAVSGSGVAAPCTYTTTVVNGQVCRTQSYARTNGENETVSTYTDFAGNSYKTSYSAGNSDIYEYDSAGRVKYHTDVNNVVTFYEYNDKGELYRTSILLGGRYKEDGSDNTPQSNDPVTETVSDCIAAENNSIYGVKRQRVFEYGDNAASGTLVRTTLTSNVDNSTSTNEFGRVTTTVDSYINDESEQGRSEVITYPDNSTLTNSYSGGLLESSTHSVLGTTTYTYNQFNQLESEERNDGGTTVKTVYTYDGRGNNLTQTTTFNGGNSRVYSRTYDKMNRVLTETQPGNRTVTNVYYENGLLKHTSGYGVYPQEYTYENGRKVSMTTWQDEDTPAVTSWSYDLSGRLTAKTYADNSATTYTYGANGKLSRRTWANGVKTDYTYDGAGRLTGVNYSDDTPDVSYVYDRRGRTVQITDGSGARNLAYNNDNSLKYEELPYFSSYRLEKEYDALGRLTKTGLKQPNGDNWAYAVSYTYDAMSRLATLSQGGKTLTYSRLTNSDRLDKAEFSPASAAPAVEYSYDTKLRLISKGCGTREFTDKDEVWYFDCPAGTPGNWGTSRYYSYDSMGQLTLAGEGALGPDGQVDNPQNFSYDSIGNHLTNNETYNILNQGSGKTYDANGNMTANGSNWIALYDGENRLRTVSHPYEGVELLYDYAGRIYQVNDFYMDGGLPPTSTLNYRRIYDGTKLIATVRNGEIQDTFVWQPETSGDADVILWDNSYVYATDPNKNVRVKRFPDEWMGSGWIEEFFDYKPFGELKNYVADPPRFMFSSEEYMPETGMYHYLYRAYSPSLARFITRDPIEEQGGVNLYCFVGNNPVSKWDNLGLSYLIIFYDPTDPMFERWANSIEQKLESNTATLYGNTIKYDKNNDEIKKIPVTDSNTIESNTLLYECISYMASCGHGREGMIWYNAKLENKKKSSYAYAYGIPGVKPKTEDLPVQDLKIFADFKWNNNAIFELYHCRTNKPFLKENDDKDKDVDHNGLSVVQYLKNNISTIRIFGHIYGINNDSGEPTLQKEWEYRVSEWFED